MIIINLKGGLGNQMFQYACGRALSLRNGDSELLLDTTGLERANQVGDIYRPYSLSHFNVVADPADLATIQKIKYPLGLISKAWRFFKFKILRQFNVRFNSRIFEIKGSVYLDGYWQTEKYFEDFKDEIRKDFEFKDQLGIYAQQKLDEILRDDDSVSVHFRRGDYVNNANHDTNNQDYYSRAIIQIKELKGQVNFYVFSDDIEWVKNNVEFLKNANFVSSPEIKDYEELYLMSKCKNHIIANSTFSWWGAWLNSNSNKIVIAPKKWVNGKENETKFADIIPSGWIRL